MDHTSCFVDTKLTKVQFFSMFSTNIYLAHKVVMNLEKTNTLGIGNTCFKKHSVTEKGSNQMLLCRNVLLPRD